MSVLLNEVVVAVGEDAGVGGGGGGGLASLQELHKFWSGAGQRCLPGHREAFALANSHQDSLEACFQPCCEQLETFEATKTTACDLNANQWERCEPLPEARPAELKKCFSDDDQKSLLVNGRDIGDIPAEFTIQGLHSHEFPVIGTYVDPRIVPGFKYRVRPLPGKKHLFEGRALKLQSVGCGYGKRITFAGDRLNGNDNYFWSDNNAEGYAFELEVVSPGDTFTVFDSIRQAIGICEVVELRGAQQEKNHGTNSKGETEKAVHVAILCKVESFQTGSLKVKLVTGTAIVTKSRHGQAQITRLSRASVGTTRHECTLIPGADRSFRTIVVTCDIPTSYSITGLQPHEIPVIGTYVDPRIVPGFKYRVRATSSKHHLFNNQALLLQSIARGYGKRITFESDCLNNNENYFWSDNQPDGYRFEIQAVFAGMRFEVRDENGDVSGTAIVFRTDSPQFEESSEILPDGSIQKRLHVDVTTHLTLSNNNNVNEGEEKAVRVSGTAVVRKGRKEREAKVIQIENPGFDSQINTVLLRKQTKVVLVAV